VKQIFVSTGERLAKNEAFFRQVNERIREIAGDDDWYIQEFLCECGDPACTERIPLTVGEYEQVRSSPRRFVLLPGHMAPEVEHVVLHGGDHLVVEKVGPAGAIAAELDPRES
jgi:hypothetical protein